MTREWVMETLADRLDELEHISIGSEGLRLLLIGALPGSMQRKYLEKTGLEYSPYLKQTYDVSAERYRALVETAPNSPKRVQGILNVGGLECSIVDAISPVRSFGPGDAEILGASFSIYTRSGGLEKFFIYDAAATDEMQRQFIPDLAFSDLSPTDGFYVKMPPDGAFLSGRLLYNSFAPLGRWGGDGEHPASVTLDEVRAHLLARQQTGLITINKDAAGATPSALPGRPGNR